MRGDFALKLVLAHWVGLFGVATAGTVMSADPGAGSFFALLIMGTFLSAFLFLPILAVTMVFVREMLRHRLAFLLVGPVAVTALASALFGAGVWKPIALQTVLSSLVLFLLLRGEADPDSAAA
jgi:hypothetical protein